MRHHLLSCTLVLALGSLGCRSDTQSASHGPQSKPAWSYSGANGPEHWGTLDPAYALARTGKQQSPVNIDSSLTVQAAMPPLVVDYHDTTLEILNNGHTIEDDYHNGGTLTIDGHVYKLAQFHFHSPSEHTIDGEHAAMEMHLVHKDAAGKLAVIGVMIEDGQHNPALETLWAHMPTAPGRSNAVEGVMVNAAKFLPPSLASFRYSGSLTTPPCTEQVDWFVLQTPIQASKAQVAALQKVMCGNNRPTQPLNGRTITASR
jgi:carbonic anhydrase